MHARKFQLGWVVILCALAVCAQDPAQLKDSFARSQQQNAQALQHYSWKSRSEIRKNGESKNTQLFLMRYDTAGNLQKTRIGGSAPPSMPKGPIFGRIAQRKKENFLELIEALQDQVRAYSQLPPGKMEAFLASSTINARMDQGTIQIQGGNILARGDFMSLQLDARTRQKRRIEINTFFDTNPLKARIEFSDLPAGPTYMARTVVDYPKEGLQLITENFDYKRER